MKKNGSVAAIVMMMAFVIGLVIDRYYKNRLLCIIAIEAATWILYLLGTLWLAHQAGMNFGAALLAGVIPFILPDLAKIVAAALIGPVLRVRINRALPAADE